MMKNKQKKTIFIKKELLKFSVKNKMRGSNFSISQIRMINQQNNYNKKIETLSISQ